MKHSFYRFDDFLVTKMLQSERDFQDVSICIDYTETHRYDAYRNCLSRMGTSRTISTQALKNWFGIGSFRMPSRDKLILLFFELGLTDDEAREWLVKGALEPDFQINDFNEIIYLYGLHHHESYEYCKNMADAFISQLDRDFTPRFHTQTTELWEAYDGHNHLKPHEFVQWMLSIQNDFKGYSYTILEYFNDLKREIVKEIRLESEKSLEHYLAETKLYQEKNIKNQSPEKKKRTILQYLKQCEKGKKEHLSDTLIRCIRELLDMSTISLDSDTYFLAEVFPKYLKEMTDIKTIKNDPNIRIMNNKYLSEILNVGLQKEQEFRLLIEAAPESKIKEQKKRCRIIGRQDLLPLILCVSQKRYIRKHGEEHYDQEEAREEFLHLANRLLVGCNMMSFHPENIVLDYILFQCFEEDDMITFAEALYKYQDKI